MGGWEPATLDPATVVTPFTFKSPLRSAKTKQEERSQKQGKPAKCSCCIRWWYRISNVMQCKCNHFFTPLFTAKALLISLAFSSIPDIYSDYDGFMSNVNIYTFVYISSEHQKFFTIGASLCSPFGTSRKESRKENSNKNTLKIFFFFLRCMVPPNPIHVCMCVTWTPSTHTHTNSPTRTRLVFQKRMISPKHVRHCFLSCCNS